VILCVEDQASPLSIRKLLLEKSGYTVLSATSGEDALRLLRSDRVDLVLSDHYLRGELGTALATRMKALKPKVPILIISGSSDALENVEGVYGFVSKTSGPTNLLVSIAKLLGL
jgi:DNA-binding NtrC family response regulator